MNNSNFVSVVMTTFNGRTKGYIQETIKSVLLQSYINFELIIVDDGSSDNTQEFIKQTFDDKRIIYIYQENGGVSKARNIGISMAKGVFICILDDDDIWVEDKLEIQLEAFNKNPNWMMQYSAINRIDENGNFLNYQYHEAKDDFYQKMLLANQVDATSSIMIKKEVFKIVGTFDSNIKGPDDYDLWLRISKLFQVGSIRQHLVCYRVHNTNESNNLEKMEYELVKVLEKLIINDISIDRNKLFFSAFINLAHKSFEVKSYKIFRKQFKKCKQFGVIPFNLTIKYYLSYCPIFIDLLRKIK